METLPRRSQTTQTTETTSIAWIELSSIRTIETIMFILKRSYGNALRRLRRSGWSKAIPEVITFIPGIENKFGPDDTEAEKIIHKCSQRVWGLFKIKESPWHQVFEEISGNSSSFSMPQNQEKKQIPRYEVRFTNKSHPFMWLVCKTRVNSIASLTTPRLLPLWRSRRSYGNYQSPQSSGSSRNILKRLGRSGRFGRSYGNQA